MPIYEFGCPSCGALISELCKVGDNGEQMMCEGCGHSGLRRHISGFASLGVSGGARGGRCSPGCQGSCTGCH